MKYGYLIVKTLAVILILFSMNTYAQKNTKKVKNVKNNQITPENCNLMNITKEYTKIENFHHTLFKKLEEIREKSLSMRVILLSLDNTTIHLPEGNFNYEKAVKLFQPFKERLRRVESLIAKCAELDNNNSIYYILQLNLTRGLYYDQSILLREIQAHDNELHILILKRKMKELEETKTQKNKGKKKS